MAIVMLSDRTMAKVSQSWMEQNAEWMLYAKASDGVWVPTCDLVQYEAGRRPFANLLAH